jgi:hypothetical protein
LNEQDRSQATVGMGSLKRSSSSSTETTEKAHKLFDPNWTDAGSATADVTPQLRAEKRRRNLYKPDQHTTTPADGALPPAPKTGADSISKAEAFTKRLRELLGKEGTRHWHVILTSFSKSAKKLPDMETLLADARGLFTPCVPAHDFHLPTASYPMLHRIRSDVLALAHSHFLTAPSS